MTKYFERVAEIEQKNPALAEELNVMFQVFVPEYQIFKAGTEKKTQKINDEDISVAERTKKLQDLQKLKIQQLAEKIGMDPKKYQPVDQDSLKTRVQEFVAKVKADANAYSADPTELDAQADLLLTALIMSR
jgi:hypothetical protein